MIITLTTDMGISDFYVASIKGSILKELPDVNIIDISHVIRPFDILHASFVIKNPKASASCGCGLSFSV